VTTRYSPTNQVLHWLTAILMLSILPVAWVAVSVPEETAPFFFWMDVHESIGLAILAVTVVRIGWRQIDSPPEYGMHVAFWSRTMARIVHAGLFLTMILMPISGYIWTTGHGHDVAPFGLIHFPRIVFNQRRLGDIAQTIHMVGRWFVYGLIGFHIAGVAYHLIVKRDALLLRMLPQQRPDRADGRP